MLFKNKQFNRVLVVVGIAAILAIFILRAEKHEDEHGHGHDDHAAGSAEVPMHVEGDEHMHMQQPQEIVKGPHGGKLFTQDDYEVEVTIFEKNVPPEFRIYTYQNGKPLAPSASKISIQLERLGRDVQPISFTQEKSYLKGDVEIIEPHSFHVDINANFNNKNYQFDYEQTEARVTLTDKQLSLNNVEVLTAGPAKIQSTLALQGEIKLNADKRVVIVPRVGGIVETVSANAGDKVSKGQVLALISSQSVADMRSDLLAIQKRAYLAGQTFSREKQLWEGKISAKQDYLQAQHDLQEAQINVNRIKQKLSAIGAGTSGKGQARYEIRSPIGGVITKKKVSIGQVVSDADHIFEVADLSTVWTEMTIYAKDINTVKVGQGVTIKAVAFDAQAEGTISYVSALVGAQSRTATARVVLNNSNGNWLPGLPVNIQLVSDEVEVPLAVSTEGLQVLRDWTVVFGRYGEYFEARPLVLGRRDSRYVEVLNGLQVGEKYAAANSFLIKADIGKAGASHDH